MKTNLFTMFFVIIYSMINKLVDNEFYSSFFYNDIISIFLIVIVIHSLLSIINQWIELIKGTFKLLLIKGIHNQLLIKDIHR